MVFRKGGILPRNLEFLFDNNILEILSKFTYLGVVFTTGGSFAETQNMLAGQARKTLYISEKYVYSYTTLTTSHMIDLFDKLILPILNYCCEVSGFIPANTVERVHLQFCKKLLGVKKSTQNDFVYGEFGRILFARRCYFIIKYWFKILTCEDGKNIKYIYKMMLSDLIERPNKINWAYLVKGLLSRMGFSKEWLNQGVENIELFLKVFKQIKRTCNTLYFLQNWNERLRNSSRASFYVTIAEFNRKIYFNSIKVLKFRTVLARLRVSSHRLEIEVGRWARLHIPVGERKCSICNQLEDEYHFVLECQLYKNLRRKYIDRFYWNRPSMYKFVELIKSSNSKTILNLAIYTYKAFKIRNSELYTADGNV